MIREMQSLLDGYWKWLKDQTSLRAVDDWIEITTPYLDRHNDCIQIYARRSEHGYLLTDDGYVLEDLEQSGCTVDHPRYRTLVDTTLNGFGVRISEGALEVEASRATFGVRKHNLLQAMMAVEDISYIAKPSDAERSPFPDVVSGWLDQSKVRCTPNVSLMGRGGYGHRFELVIPKSVAKPERVVRAFNRPNRTAAMNMAFSWVDTRRVRSDDSTAYAIHNDERPVADEVLVAMGAYGVRPVRWSDRDAAREELAA